MIARRARQRRTFRVKRLFLPKRPINHYRGARKYPAFYHGCNGHLTFNDPAWRYQSCGSLVVPGRTRPCVRCGRLADRGQDHCIAKLPDVKYACCGHGAHEGYVSFSGPDRHVFRFGPEKTGGQIRRAVSLVWAGKPVPPGFVWDPE